MGALYSVSRRNVTPVAGDVLIAILAGGNIIVKITEISVSGRATASGVNDMSYFRSTTNGITPTALASEALSTSTPAAQATAASTFATQPVTAAQSMWTQSINAFGGLIRQMLPPSGELYFMGATAGDNEGSLESTAGVNPISCQVYFEEL